MLEKIKDYFNLIVFGISRDGTDERVEGEMNKLKARAFDMVTLAFLINIVTNNLKGYRSGVLEVAFGLIIIVVFIKTHSIGVGAMSPINFSKGKKITYRVIPIAIGFLLVPLVNFLRDRSFDFSDGIIISFGILVSIIYAIKLGRKDVEDIA